MTDYSDLLDNVRNYTETTSDVLTDAVINQFIRSTEDDNREIRQAKIYITPDLIGDNQPSFEDEVKLTYAGSVRTGQIINIDTKQGGQTYLFTLLVRF